MKRFGYRIHNHGRTPTVFHYRRRRTPIPPKGFIRGYFPTGYDAADAVDELREVMLQLAASVCAETYRCEFEIIPTEFGYELRCPRRARFDVVLTDPEPPRYVLPDGYVLSTSQAI